MRMVLIIIVFVHTASLWGMGFILFIIYYGNNNGNFSRWISFRKWGLKTESW